MVGVNPPFNSTLSHDPYYKFIAAANNHKLFWQVMEHQKSGLERFLTKSGKKRYYSKAFKSMINGLIAQDPTERPTFAELKQHPWYLGELPTQQERFDEFKIIHAEIKRKKKIEKAAERK